MGAGVAPRAGAKLPLAPTPEAPEGSCSPTADPDWSALRIPAVSSGPVQLPGMCSGGHDRVSLPVDTSVAGRPLR